MALNEDFMAAVTNVNMKLMGDFPTLYYQKSILDHRLKNNSSKYNLTHGNNRLNGALDALITRCARSLVKVDMMEALAAVKINSGLGPL